MKSSNIGGQAVMEGIMMRHGDVYSVGVRKPNGEIEVKVEDYKSIFGNHKWMKWPMLRGVVSFVDSLVVGIRCLMYSATFFEDEEEKEPKELTPEEEAAKQAREERENKWMMYGTVALSIVLTVGLFMILPYYLAGLLRNLTDSETLIALSEAIVRILIFLIYLLLISRMKDIQRTFMYHGAEHKCINCVENGMELTVENVMKSSRQHKRCGTSFLMFVVVISVIFYLFISLIPFQAHWIKVALRLALVPVIAGVAYEIIRLAGSSDNKCVTILSKPGLVLQKLTTKEPDESMAEVAIAAVEAVFDWRAYLAGEEDTSAAHHKGCPEGCRQ